MTTTSRQKTDFKWETNGWIKFCTIVSSVRRDRSRLGITLPHSWECEKKKKTKISETQYPCTLSTFVSLVSIFVRRRPSIRVCTSLFVSHFRTSSRFGPASQNGQRWGTAYSQHKTAHGTFPVPECCEYLRVLLIICMLRDRVAMARLTQISDKMLDAWNSRVVANFPQATHATC